MTSLQTKQEAPQASVSLATEYHESNIRQHVAVDNELNEASKESSEPENCNSSNFLKRSFSKAYL